MGHTTFGNFYTRPINEVELSTVFSSSTQLLLRNISDVFLLHEFNEGGKISDTGVVPSKYLCPGGTVPCEPVSILFC